MRELEATVHKRAEEGSPGGSVVESPPANSRDEVSIPDPGGLYLLQSN